MLLKLTSLAAMIGAGFGLGRMKFRVNVRLAILTGLLAVAVHAGVRLVLPHEAIEKFAQSHLDTTKGQIILMMLASVETAGLLLPVALMPWTDASSRAW